MLTFQAILHPTDFSRGADYAFRLAMSLARDHGAKLIALHVNPPPLNDFDFQEKDAMFKAQLWEAFHRVEAVDPRVREVRIDTMWVEGDPAREIVRVAKDKECDLIVMGTHGRTGLDRLVMGSVAEKVSRTAPCPVLTAKTPQAKAAPESSEVVEELEEVVEA
jgi:nucleotide-binding universal stress UspA family protein